LAERLIPTDATLEQDIDAPDVAVPLDRVSEILEPATRLRLIILDACRDNPFVRSMRRTLATRMLSRALQTGAARCWTLSIGVMRSA
jgi:uncharacterized caspase-like protein